MSGADISWGCKLLPSCYRVWEQMVDGAVGWDLAYRPESGTYHTTMETSRTDPQQGPPQPQTREAREVRS
jgi:hypothetical protein